MMGKVDAYILPKVGRIAEYETEIHPDNIIYFLS